MSRCFVSVLATLFLLTSISQAEVLVKVNGEELTDADLEFLYLSRRIPEDTRAVVRDRYINMLIERALLKQFLKERKLSASKLLVDQHVARVEKLIKRENLEVTDVLKSLGYTKETFREEVALPLTWKTHTSMVITKQAMQRFWQQQKSHFDGTRIKASHIVKKIPQGASESDIEEITKTLTDLKEEIESEKLTFDQAAFRHSDSPSKKKFGDLGSFPYSGTMPNAITRVAFAIKEGHISKPFRSRFGMHILKVTGVEPGELTLEDARPEIFEFLSEELRQKLITKLRDEAKIEWSATAKPNAAVSGEKN